MLPRGPDLANGVYELGLFHDNNSREAEAIPHYAAALSLDLDHAKQPLCRAYLASSLYKVGQYGDAQSCAEKALSESNDAQLTSFIEGLLNRIERKLASA
jgi:tetratricopeptide (TPR) repeat protein